MIAESLRSHPRPGSATPGALTVAVTITSGGTNPSGRRKEDDFNLVAGPLGGGHDGIGRRSEDDPNLVAELPIAGTIKGFGERGWSNSAESVDLMSYGGPTVRRLTPTECERLQALPDGWTNPNGDAPDSRRYAALGDAVTSSVGEWIGRRIIAEDAQATIGMVV